LIESERTGAFGPAPLSLVTVRIKVRIKAQLSLSSHVSGLILAGGLGRRMGRVEKGLQLLRGRALIEWVVAGFRPQVDELLISANQQLDAYARYGLAVLPDVHRESGGEVAGPLAGLHAGMMACRHDLIATVPCDVPFPPADLVGRLRAALLERSAQVAVATIGGRVQPVFVLARKDCLPALDAYITSGQRRADGWYAGLSSVEVSFDDEAAAFANINTLTDLKRMEGRNEAT